MLCAVYVPSGQSVDPLHASDDETKSLSSSLQYSSETDSLLINVHWKIIIEPNGWVMDKTSSMCDETYVYMSLLLIVVANFTDG